MRGRPRQIDHDAVLNLWKVGFTSEQIATYLGLRRSETVRVLVLTHRRRGDKRATLRRGGYRSLYELPDAVSA
jgi:hypothetical protein